MNTEIREAIAQRRVLELRYHGYNRVVEPHAYGRDKSSDEILRCYQVGGDSESGERVGWKLLKVAEAHSVHKLTQTFVQRPQYRPNDKSMEYMFCQL